MPPCRHSAWYRFFVSPCRPISPTRFPTYHAAALQFCHPPCPLPMAVGGLNANGRNIPGLVGRLYLLRLLLAAAFCLRRLLPRHGQCQNEPVAPLYNNVGFGIDECWWRTTDGALNPGSARQPMSSCRNQQPLTPWTLNTRPADCNAP